MAYTIAQDTICTGYTCVIFYDDAPAEFATEAEAIAEMDSDPEFYAECFVCPIAELGHKTIFNPSR